MNQDLQAGDEALEEEKGSRAARIATWAALALIAVAAVYVLLFGGEDYEVTAEFDNASQLVGGEEVVIGGANAGSVKEIEIGPRGSALVTFTVKDDFAPLKRGTIATVRSYSLSGIANRQVQLTLPPEGKAGEEIPSHGRLSREETVSEVDLDQLFNTLDPETVEDFKHVIQGFERSYVGVEKKANRGFRLLNPFLYSARRVFGELNLDQRTFERLIVDTSKLSGALAERSPDVSALVSNLNLMMGALARQKQSLADSVRKLPPFMRQANTTFVNLRSTLGDLDPLVTAAKPVATRLRPFLTDLRAAADDAVPTVRGLDAAIRRPGSANDLVELTRLQVPLRGRALGSGSPECGPNPTELASLQIPADDDFTQGAFGETICSLQNSLNALSYFRTYTPELVGWFNDFSGASAALDATGGKARIATTFNAFSAYSNGVPELSPLPEAISEAFPGLTSGLVKRCPGANERPPEGEEDSHPFTDGGALTDGVPGECDPSMVPPGP